MGRERTIGQGRLLYGNDICDVNAKQLQEYLREECSKQIRHGHELGSFRRQMIMEGQVQLVREWKEFRLERWKGLGDHWGVVDSVMDLDFVLVGFFGRY